MKKNLTLALDEDLVREARIKALREGTSVNAVLRRLLREYVRGREEFREAMKDLIRIAESAGGRSGRRKWTREELYDRRGDA